MEYVSFLGVVPITLNTIILIMVDGQFGMLTGDRRVRTHPSTGSIIYTL